MRHHRDSFIGVEVGFTVERGEAQKRFLCVFETTTAHQPPRRFWSEEHSDEERKGPHPLQRIRDAVCPFICAMKHGADDSNGDKLAQAPAHIDVGSQVAAEGDRTH